jgi:hypothetical protein
LQCGECSDSLDFLGWASFALDLDDLINRMEIILTLLLTSTAFKFVYAEKIPKVDYVTILDMYMNINLLMLLLQAVLHVCVYCLLKYEHFTERAMQMVEIVSLG